MKRDLTANKRIKSDPPSQLRFSLVTLISATAVFAVWIACFTTLLETRRLTLEVKGLHEIARELRVDDPQQYAVVHHHEVATNDFRWRVFLPPDTKYQLCLSTSNFDRLYHRRNPKPAPSMVAPLEPGELEVMMTYEKLEEEWIVQVSVDGQILLQESRPLAWKPSASWKGGSRVQASRQQSTDEPLELFDRVFEVPDPKATNGFGYEFSENGLRLWIEKLEPKSRK